jgi:hypothetical protein
MSRKRERYLPSDEEAERQQRLLDELEHPRPGYGSLRDADKPARGRPLSSAPINESARSRAPPSQPLLEGAAVRPPILMGWLTEQELATELRRDVRTLMRWRSAGIGPPFVRTGSALLYDREKVCAWLAAGGTKPRRRGRVRSAA